MVAFPSFGDAWVSGPMCPHCHVYHNVRVPAAEYAAWQNGALIQDALVSLTAEDREKLISGFCAKGWKALFGEDE